jgi:hydrogenase-4 component F
MNGGMLWLLLLGPLLGSAASLASPTPGVVLTLAAAGAAVILLLAAPILSAAFAGQQLQAAGGWLFLDPLSAYHLGVLLLVFLLGSVHARGYFSDEHEHGHFPLRTARRFGALWFGALAAMVLVLLSNNLGIMWVGIEASTLLTAFLICLHNTQRGLRPH